MEYMVQDLKLEVGEQDRGGVPMFIINPPSESLS